MSNLPLKPLSETDEYQRVGSAKKRERLAVRLDAKLRGALRACVERRKLRNTLIGVLGLAIVGGGVGAYFAVRAKPKPDPWAGLDELFDYTLLTDDFNDLPVEERLAMIRAIIEKMQSMDSSDSVLLATFAAQIKGYAREQLEKNASRLAIDLWDDYASKYENVPLEKRGTYLEDTLVEFVEIAEAMGGNIGETSREEILSEARENARRDANRMQDGKVSGRQMKMFVSVIGRMDDHSSPAKRARGLQLMRDMTRHLRGEDLGGG